MDTRLLFHFRGLKMTSGLMLALQEIPAAPKA
jgi:hypothetical protein